MPTQMLTRNEVEAALRPIDSLEERIVTMQGKGLEFSVGADDGGLRLRVLKDQFKVQRPAFEQALVFVPGLTKPAISDWPTDMLLTPVNWFLQHRGEEMRMLISGDEIVAFPKKITTMTPTTQLLDQVVGAVVAEGADPDTLQYDKVRVSLDRCSVAIISPENRAEAKKGDALNGGVMLLNSPTGRADIEVSAYVNRLVCTNGMISPVALRSFRVRRGSSGFDHLSEWVTDAARESWLALDGEFSALRDLTQIPVDGHGADVLRDVFTRHRVPARLRDAVQEALIEEGDGSLYGIAQAFNRAANGQEDIGAMRHLLMVTGEMAHQTSRCSECLRSLN
jgi:hypothetical protein